MVSHTPKPRLRHFDIGDRVRLPHDKKTAFTILSKRGDGYTELSYRTTASDGHECEVVK